MKPHVHAENSVKRFGGKPEDYLDIHDFMDSSKAIVGSNLHRVFTHNSWFIRVVLPRVFGETILNSDGKTVSIYDIGEQHVLEDFRGRYIPSGQDYLDEITNVPEWIHGEKKYPKSMTAKFRQYVKADITPLNPEMMVKYIGPPRSD